MAPRTLSTLLLLMFVAVPATAAWATETGQPDATQATAQERLEEANDLWLRKKDYNGALDAFNEAVRLAPDDVAIRLRRGGFLESVAAIVVEQDKEKFQQFARDDYLFVTEEAPDSVAAGVARDRLRSLNGQDLFPEEATDCPDDADQAYEQAESLFHQGRYEESLKHFRVATSACSASADMLRSHADAHFMLKDYARARELFLQALKADPWNRKAHRFLADTENRLGNNEAALRHSALAVVADPTYEAAWSSLRRIAEILGRGWRRVYGEKPRVVRRDEDGGGGGKSSIQVTLPAPEEDPEAPGGETVLEVAAGEDEEFDPDRVLWMGYGVTKAAVLGGRIVEDGETGQPVVREIDPESLSPFQIEERTVETTLKIMRELADQAEEGDPQVPGPFWAMMASAAEAGFLKEAIFLHLMDEDLVDEYLAFRETNADRLVEYLETLVTPPPTGDSAAQDE